MATRIQIRHDTAANWQSYNPVLAIGELGIETDTRKIKVGDGETRWINLSYIAVDITTNRTTITSTGNHILSYPIDVLIINVADGSSLNAVRVSMPDPTGLEGKYIIVICKQSSTDGQDYLKLFQYGTDLNDDGVAFFGSSGRFAPNEVTRFISVGSAWRSG